MQRIDYTKLKSKPLNALADVHRALMTCGLEHNLIQLIYLRASQINGCAYCIDMHWKDAVAAGEDAQRLYMLQAWREWPQGYSDRERAALAWTEAVTQITDGHAPDTVYRLAREQFSETELTNLTAAVTLINSFNRLAISFRHKAGDYQPASSSRKNL